MQTILTQCPRCQTSFKVSDKQLAIASGMVRCGSCLDVFSAPDNRITIKQPAPAAPPPEPFPDEHEADNLVEPSAPVTASPSAQDDRYRHEASRFMESASPESSHGVNTSVVPDPSFHSATTGSAVDTDDDASAPVDDFEFMLDYEDDVQLGDMMLDELGAEVLDAGIHDAAAPTAGHKYEEPAHTFEESFNEFEDTGIDAGSIHEIAPQTADTATAHEAPVPVENFAGNNANDIDSATEADDYPEETFPEVDGASLQETISELKQNAEPDQSSGQPDEAPAESEEIIAFIAQEFPPEQEHHEHIADQQSHDELADEGERATAAADDQPSGDDAFAAEIIDEEPGFSAHGPAVDDDDQDSLYTTSSSADDDELSEPDDLDVPAFSALSSHEIEEIELSVPKPHGQREKAELREYLAELEDADALEALPPTTMESIEEEPLTLEVRSVFRRYVTTFGWAVLSLFLLAALVLQVVAHNLEFMQRSPSYSRYLPVFCKLLECPQPQNTAAAQNLRSQDLLVRSHPTVADALEVSFIFSNDGDMPQAFPLIELRFMDSSRRLMANRMFRPDEYLPPELDALGEMPASSSVQVAMEMVDPGSDAVVYEITFRDPLTESPIGSSTPATTP